MLLTEIEQKVIHKRICGGLSFGQLSEDEKLLAADKIVAQCISICGCKPHQSEKISEVLSEELAIFIDGFGYHSLNLDEIVLALRFNTSNLKNPSGIEIEPIIFTGYYANVNYISKVLHNYKVIRDLIDRKFQNKLDGY